MLDPCPDLTGASSDVMVQSNKHVQIMFGKELIKVISDVFFQ